MELYTRILLPKARFSFSYEDRVVMMAPASREYRAETGRE